MTATRAGFVAILCLYAQAACVLHDEQTAEEENTSTTEWESTSQCNTGQMCFWDDNGFSDSFRALTSSLSNFNDINFGDKTTSVLNRAAVAWVLFDDAGFSDTRVCIKAGASVANFGNFGFNDKVSSARRRSDDTCPSGVRVFTGIN